MASSGAALVADIWRSFRALPVWVQIWVALWLVPVNMASLAFVGEPYGVLVALLAIGAMAMNLPVMLRERGFSRAMALPHLLPWTGLVLWLALARPGGSSGYGTYLTILLATDLASLAFDYPDAIRWWRGEREVAGRG